MEKNKSEIIMSFLLNRRSVLAAKLNEPGPSKKQLDDIITAGIRVPDHGRCSPWRVQVVSKEGQRKLGKLLSEIVEKNDEFEKKEQIDYWYNRPQSAPCLLIITLSPNRDNLSKIPIIEQELSCGAFCQNILNASHALGFSAQWLTEWPAYNSEVKKFLGYNEDTKILGFIYIGTSLEAPKERKRVISSEIINYFD
ncbi:MAG: putative NAD(P)H nitroreductase YdjA [Alphaproteobacteria bacterium MarineAlpha2_Bin1]|nr:MAG: putative NAD(P)H nitroreductase YdjA [Alphaproteobacteria bacterium MarineAlpha2_Bin1]